MLSSYDIIIIIIIIIIIVMLLHVIRTMQFNFVVLIFKTVIANPALHSGLGTFTRSVI